MSEPRLRPASELPRSAADHVVTSPTPLGQRSVPALPDPAESPEDGTYWLVGVLVELAKRFISAAAKRYPDLRAGYTCKRCGHRG